MLEDKNKETSTLKLSLEDSTKLKTFTEQARRVIDAAFEETKTFQHNYIGTEHLLLGLLSDNGGVAAVVLHEFNVDLPQLRNAVEEITGYGDHSGEIGLSLEVRNVIELTLEEASQLNQSYVDTEHLLLGLLRNRKSVAIAVLESLDINPDQVQTQTLRTIIRAKLLIEKPISDNEQKILQVNSNLVEVDRCPFCNATKIRQQAKFCDMCGHALPPGVPSPMKADVDNLLEEAYTLYTQKRLDEAVSIYNQALQLDKTNALGWQGLGLTQRLRGLDHEALTSFERALQLDPGLVISWNGKGTVLSKLRRHREALEAFEHALQLDLTRAAAWNGKGIALSALGRSKQALTAFETALRFDPSLVQAWCNKGVLLYEMNRYAEAERAYQEAISLDSKLPLAYFGCGQALYAQRKLKQALRMFERAIQEDLKYIEAWSRRGNILDELGDTTQALQSYEQALQIDAHYAPAWSGKGGILRQLGNYSDALKAYNFALDFDPNFVLAWNGKGNTLYNMQNFHESLAAYERALELNPRLRTAWHNKSLVLNELHRYDEALQAAEEAIRLRPDDPDNWLRKAEALEKLGRHEEESVAMAEAERLQRDQSQVVSMSNDQDVNPGVAREATITVLQEKETGIQQNTLGNAPVDLSDVSAGSTGETTTNSDLTGSGILSPNSRLQQGRYIVMKLLSQGRWGTSVLAKDTHTSNKLVIIKELISVGRSDPVQRGADVPSFEMEARILTGMDHPLIPNMTDYFQEGSHYYLVQEYVAGESLEDRMERLNQPLSEREALIHASQVLDILDYLSKQEAPIVHRDIKPSSIIIGSKDERAHLIDFSIACAVEATGTKRRQTSALGTPGFAPPEQYQGNADPRSDLYALGATMHHLLTNRDPRNYPPFTYPPVRTLNLMLSPEVEAVLNCALSNDINARYQSAIAMKRDIDEILAHRFGIPVDTSHKENILDSNEKVPSLSRRHSTRIRWLFIGLILLIIMGCIGLTLHIAPFSSPPTLTLTSSIGSGWPMVGFDSQQTRFNPSENILNSENVSHLTPYWTAATGQVTGSSPAVVNGIVYVGSYDHRLYALDARTGATLWTYTAEDVISSSPSVANGIVYFSSWDGNLYALDATTGQKVWSYSTEGQITASPTVVNGIVYFGSLGTPIFYALDARTGAVVWTHPIEGCSSLAAIANGIVYVRSVYGKLYALDAKTGAIEWSKSGKVSESSPAIANNAVYITSDNTYAFDAKSGERLWMAAIEQAQDSAPAIAYGTVYISSEDWNLYALNARTGKILWKVPEGYCNWGGPGSLTPAVLNGMVFVDCGVFDASTGKHLWSYPSYRGSAFPIVVVGGVIYITGDNWRLSTLHLPSSKA